MARTFGGMLFYGAENLNLPSTQQGVAAGQYSWVRNADGTLTLNNAAGVGTVNIQMGLADLKRPFINFPAFPGQGNALLLSNELQEAFGTAAGGPGNPIGPGFPGANTGTPAIPWGLAVVDVFAVYSVQTAALTTATLALTRNTFVENVAVAQTNVLAATGIALTTTGAANAYHVQKVTLAQPLIYESVDFSNLVLELLITTAATSAVRVAGLGMHLAVEYS